MSSKCRDNDLLASYHSPRSRSPELGIVEVAQYTYALTVSFFLAGNLERSVSLGCLADVRQKLREWSDVDIDRQRLKQRKTVGMWHVPVYRGVFVVQVWFAHVRYIPLVETPGSVRLFRYGVGLRFLSGATVGTRCVTSHGRW